MRLKRQVLVIFMFQTFLSFAQMKINFFRSLRKIFQFSSIQFSSVLLVEHFLAVINDRALEILVSYSKKQASLDSLLQSFFLSSQDAVEGSVK
jgi:hypothetical protein